MSDLQSLREFISKRLAAAAVEIFLHCERTIVQYEEELCRQHRLSDITWKPQFQLHATVLPQNYVTEEEDLCYRQRNFNEEQKAAEPPRIEKQHNEFSSQMKEEREDPEPPQIKHKQEGYCTSQDKEQLDVKQETYTIIPTYKENEYYEADLHKQQSFNVTDNQNEEGSHKESASATDGETDLHNRDQRKTKDRSQIVQAVDSSLMSESHYDSDFQQIFKKATLVKKRKQSPKEKRRCYMKSVDESLKIVQYVSRHIGHDYEERPNVLVCDKCGESFSQRSCLKAHLNIHKEKKPFSCNECDKKFSQKCDLKRHIRTHTGEKPFSCKECSTRFSQISSLKRHMRAHTGVKPYSCKECEKSFSRISGLKKHMRTHSGVIIL